MFFNHGSIYLLINIYSDSSQLALKYFKDTEVNINNVLIMTRDFDIRDCLWDLSYSFHTLFEIADTFHIKLSKSTEIFPTRYFDNT